MLYEVITIGVDIPADAAPGSYVIPVTLISEQHCLWEQDRNNFV